MQFNANLQNVLNIAVLSQDYISKDRMDENESLNIIK